MAEFNFVQCVIDMSGADGGYAATRRNLEFVPDDPAPTMSLTHEYVHFLQLLSSLAGFNILERMVNLGVGVARILAARTGPETSLRILPLLEALNPNTVADNQGLLEAGILAEIKLCADEIKVLFQPHYYPYVGTALPWQCERNIVEKGTFSDEKYGFIAPNGLFRPFTPGLAAEGMARQIDQWLKRNMGFAAHAWTESDEETDYYQGILTLLGQERYSGTVPEALRDKVNLIVCGLALVTPHPDFAIAAMLRHLEGGALSGAGPEIIEEELRCLLISEDELNADYYNTTMREILTGTVRVMEPNEYKSIHCQLRAVHSAASRVLRGPGFLLDETVRWQHIEELMSQYSIPPIKVRDGDLFEYRGHGCNRGLYDYFMGLERIGF